MAAVMEMTSQERSRATQLASAAIRSLHALEDSIAVIAVILDPADHRDVLPPLKAAAESCRLILAGLPRPTKRDPFVRISLNQFREANS